MRSWLALLLIVLFCLTPLMGQAEELPLLDFSAVKDRFVSNPRNVKDIGDPFVLAEDNAYYMYATGGPILKRMIPASKGRGYRINKRTSHVTLTVAEKD